MALKRKDFYKCSDEDCTTVVEVVTACGCGDECKMTCCGKPMEKMEEKTADFKTEKHVPVVEKVEGGYKVTVGSTLHPMTEEHYIQMIELVCGDRFMRAYLRPGDAPEAFFPVKDGCKCECGSVVPVARELCNIHGLWTTKG